MIHINDEIYMDLKLNETNVDDFDLYQEVILTEEDMQLTTWEV